jgi:hypothetical protein
MRDASASSKNDKEQQKTKTAARRAKIICNGAPLVLY